MFISCRTKHQLSRQSQNFQLPWTVPEKTLRSLSLWRQLYALLTVKNKSCFSACLWTPLWTFVDWPTIGPNSGWGGGWLKKQVQENNTSVSTQDAITCLNSSCHSVHWGLTSAQQIQKWIFCPSLGPHSIGCFQRKWLVWHQLVYKIHV